MGLLSTKQAAERLKIDASRVRRLILDNRLPAEKMGRDWLINEKDLKLVADRKPGRPSKEAGSMAAKKGGVARASAKKSTKKSAKRANG